MKTTEQSAKNDILAPSIVCHVWLVVWPKLPKTNRVGPERNASTFSRIKLWLTLLKMHTGWYLTKYVHSNLELLRSWNTFHWYWHSLHISEFCTRDARSHVITAAGTNQTAWRPFQNRSRITCGLFSASKTSDSLVLPRFLCEVIWRRFHCFWKDIKRGLCSDNDGCRRATYRKRELKMAVGKCYFFKCRNSELLFFP